MATSLFAFARNAQPSRLASQVSLFTLLLGAASLWGCSSETGVDDGGGATTSSGGDVASGVGGQTSGAGGSQAPGAGGRTPGGLEVTPAEPDPEDLPSDGGSVVLTPEQIEAIETGACAGWNAEGETVPAVLQLVVDTSFSMTFSSPGSRESKWEVTAAALQEALAALPPSVAVGILFYPNQDSMNTTMEQPLEQCVNTEALVPIDFLGDAGSAHRATLTASIDDAVVASYTPTHDAYRYALQQGLVPYQGVGHKFMLLITDGSPTMRTTCNGSDPEGGTPGPGAQAVDQPTQPIIDEIAAAATQGINTFLIGSPGSEQSSESNTDMRPWLSNAALAGATAPEGCEADGPNFCHLDMTQEPDFAAALDEGLKAIAGEIVDTCTFQLPAPPTPDDEIDPNKTNVIVSWGSGEKALLLRDDIDDCSEGWTFNADGAIELCAASCQRLKSDVGASVDLNFGCAPEEIVPK